MNGWYGVLLFGLMLAVAGAFWYLATVLWPLTGLHP